MANERLVFQPLIPMKQGYEGGCVPTAISMVLSGFGANTNEEALVDRYFPTARLPREDPNCGVSMASNLRGIIKILKDMGLQDRLQVDTFEPDLSLYTRLLEERYIVKSPPEALREHGEEKFYRSINETNFYKTLRELADNKKVGVYAANARMMGLEKWGLHRDFSDQIERGFYTELADFARRGHIVITYGLGTAHAVAVDGTRTTEEGFWIVDPDGTSYAISRHEIVSLDAGEVKGLETHFFRISPWEVLNPQLYGFRTFVQRLRNLIPGNNEV